MNRQRQTSLGAALAICIGTWAHGQCEPQWLPGDALPGTGYEVFAMTEWDDGRGSALYLGGWFMVAGDQHANGIVRWDGNSWESLGDGLPGNEPLVNAIAVFNDELIVAGEFGQDNIARWDGTQWRTLSGGGVDGYVNAMAVYNGELIVAGNFYTAGGIAARNIARWDGSQWSTVGSGAYEGNDLWGVSVVEDDLIAVGWFSSIGGVAASHIARWDGANWSPIGGGIPFNGRAVIEFQGEIYAGGLFGIRRFDAGTNQWTQVGGGLNSSARVYALAVSPDDELVVGGSFNNAGGIPVGSIARWDGTQWLDMPSLAGHVSCFEVYTGDLHAAGDILAFEKEGIFSPTNNVARWDGAGWHSLGRQLNSVVYDILSFEGDLIAGGSFTTIGGIEVTGAGRWDGSEWSMLGSGLHQYVRDLEILNGELIAATGSSVLRFDGAQWQTLGGPMNGSVFALRVYDGKLIAGGSFTHAGGTTVNRIAKWNGTTWQPLGSGVNSDVRAFAEYQGDLIAAGFFTTAGGTAAARIARWDGAEWHALGTGLSDDAFALTIHDNELIAGGWFSSAGGVNARGVAAWDGESWRKLGGGVSGIYEKVSSLGVFDGDLIAGGVFSHAGGVETRNLARWDGTQWQGFDGGVGINEGEGSEVFAIAEYESKLFVGGTFITVGDHVSPYLASWGSPCEGLLAPLASFRLRKGEHLSGGLGKLESSDNARMKIASEFTGDDPPYWMIVEFKLNSEIPDPTSLDVLVEAKLTENGGIAKIYLKNWNSGQWDRIARCGIGRTEETNEVAGLDASKYVNSQGKIRLRVRHETPISLVGGEFESHLDGVRVLVR